VAGVKEVLDVTGVPAGSYLLTVSVHGHLTTHPVVVSK
jgi:hypothetical protein